MPTGQGELARDPATGDGEKHRRRVPVTRQETDHHTTTRTHQLRGSTRRFAQRTRRTNLHRTRGRLDASSHQLRGSATSCPPPRPTGDHRCHLGSPRLAERHPQAPVTWAPMPALGLGICVDAGPAALDDANKTIVRRITRQRRFDEDIEQAKTAAREAFLVVKRAQQAPT